MASSSFRPTRRNVLALPAIALLSSRTNAATPIIDAAGRRVTLAKPAERIVVGFYAEEFTAIAGADGWARVVGLSKRQWTVNRAAIWRRYLAAVPRLGDIADVGAWEDQTFSAEKVLALKPDLLIVPPWALTAHTAQIAPLQAAGIPVLVADYNAQLPEKHTASTLAIGAAIGADERARELADLYATRVADTMTRARKAGRAPRVYVEIGMGGPGVIGNSYRETMWGRIVDTIGATNIANGAIPTGFNPMSPEKVLAAAPEFIFITGSSWAGQPNAVRLGYDVDLATARSSLRPYLDRPGWAALPAVKSGNLFTLEHSLTRSLMDWISMQYIAKQLYPEHFGDADPATALRDFHDRYLPVAFAGTWMARLTDG